MKLEKVFVTGGNGFIASHVIDELKRNNIQVVTCVRGKNFQADWLEGVTVYEADIRDKAAMYSIIEKCDGVIHLAGILGTKHVTNAWNFYDINVQGAINILEACMEFKTPLVGIGVGNFWETNNYSNSKYAAEREILKYARFGGVKANVVRGLNAIGPRQKVKNTGKIMATFITAALNNEPLQVYGGKLNCGIMDMIYVTDLARILVEVLHGTSEEMYTAQVFEAGTGIGYSVYEIAQRVIKATNSKSEIIEVPMRSGEGERSEVVAKEPFTFDYIGLDEAIEKTVEYYKQVLSK